MRMLIRYSRGGAARYVSHLDMQRAFMRALRRARIPAVYSSGYNPHIQMSFAAPLSVGYATDADYFEVKVEEGLDAGQVIGDLNACLPDSLKVSDAFYLPDGLPKLMALSHSADYEARLNFKNETQYDRIDSALGKIMGAQDYAAYDRKGREINLRRLIISARFDRETVYCTLYNGSSGSLNPAALIEALIKEADAAPAGAPQIKRAECYAALKGRILPFFKLKDLVLDGKPNELC